MLATAIIGSTVGVKYARRRKPRPAILPLTQTAISSASAIDTGIVPVAYQRLFDSACQKIGSVAELRVIVGAYPRRGAGTARRRKEAVPERRDRRVMREQREQHGAGSSSSQPYSHCVVRVTRLSCPSSRRPVAS